MRSVIGVVARLFWRSLPFSGKPGPRVRKLDLGVGNNKHSFAGRPGKTISQSDGLGGRLQAESGIFASGGSTFRSATHRLFVNNILRRVTNSQSNQLRRRAADQLVNGNSAPFLALVGVSLASGAGLITKEDELECVFREVRHASQKTRLIEENQCQAEEGSSVDVIDLPPNKETLTNEDLEFGPVVAKGCNAVVYSARWVTRTLSTHETSTEKNSSDVIKADESPDDAEVSATRARGNQNITKEVILVEEFTQVTPDMNGKSEPLAKADSEIVVASIQTQERETKKKIKEHAVISRKVNDAPHVKVEEKEKNFPLAVKIMFNYDIESNAFSILRAMQREIVIAQSMFLPEETSNLLENRTKTLPFHPNIVRMVAAFADRVPSFSDSMDLYPAALPKRLNPSGYGRNMSLFLVMKRYDSSLRTFLDEHGEQISWRTSLVLLTQLLEGIAHMVRYRVCHRDLKTDNLLVDKSGGFEFPLLSIADFGCCLADKQLGLKVPFTSLEIDRGGNAALMAPEIATAQPGIFTYLDYSQADVWAAGTIAYEIFGFNNPFYDDRTKKRHLDSRTYSSADLPKLPSSVPSFVTSLVHEMLNRLPGKRISAELAATVCQLYLWAPRSWIDPESPSYPNTQDILQWMLTMTTKVLYESRFSNARKAHREYQLVSSFLSRVTLKDTKLALAWIRQHSEFSVNGEKCK